MTPEDRKRLRELFESEPPFWADPEKLRELRDVIGPLLDAADERDRLQGEVDNTLLRTELAETKAKMELLRGAALAILAVAYVGNGQIVCPRNFEGPIRRIYEVLLALKRDGG